MVEWDSKERGVPLDAFDTIRGFYLGCSDCRRWIALEHSTALARFGPIYTRDLARRLRCSNCGARRGYVMVWAASNA